MLNLSFSTLPCEGWNVEKVIQYCIENGYKGLELKDDNSFIPLNSTEEERKKVAEAFAREKIIFTDIATGVNIRGISEEEAANALEAIKLRIDFAADLNAKGVRVMFGNFCRRYDTPREELNHERIVDFTKKACDYAKAYGKEIWIETHNEFGTGRALRNLLDSVSRENCGVIWDIMHPLEDGETPKETLKYLGAACKHIHVKDGIPFEDKNEHDWKYTSLGKGVVPIKDIVNLLLQNGFKGFFSLEWETKWRTELQVPGAEPENVLPYYAEYMRTLNNNEEII
jgi:sugar phosphate isomerase/epimerase